MEGENLVKAIDEENFTATLDGVFSIAQVAAVLELLKAKKTATVKTAFKVGDRVYRKGYREYGPGEIVEVDIYIHDSGEESVEYLAESLGAGYEGEFELVK